MKIVFCVVPGLLTVAAVVSPVAATERASGNLVDVFLEAEVLPNTDMQVSSLRLFYNKPDTGVRLSYCWGLEAYDPEHGWGFDNKLGGCPFWGDRGWFSLGCITSGSCPYHDRVPHSGFRSPPPSGEPHIANESVRVPWAFKRSLNCTITFSSCYGESPEDVPPGSEASLNEFGTLLLFVTPIKLKLTPSGYQPDGVQDYCIVAIPITRTGEVGQEVANAKPCNPHLFPDSPKPTQQVLDETLDDKRDALIAELVKRDELVAAQENLLNDYRCLYNVDTQIVAGGCGDSRQPHQQPGDAPNTATQTDINTRDLLIQNQENLLNVYRCRFGVDTQLVQNGCT